MSIKQLTSEEIEDLKNLLRKSDMKIHHEENSLNVVIEGYKTQDEAEQRIGTLLNYINQNANYSFVLDHGMMSKLADNTFEIEIVPRKK